jgi:hypothetical protein
MTNALPGLVQSDKKAEVVLSDGRFATIYKVKVGHILAAEDENQMHQAVKLIAVTVRIDDKFPTIEDVLNLDVEDFHKIMHQLSISK